MPPPRQSEASPPILYFAQAMHILRANETITRADARAWINREFPNAKLVTEDALAQTPDDPPPIDRLDFTAPEPDPDPSAEEQS